MKVSNTQAALLLQTMCAKILVDDCMQMTTNGLCDEFTSVADSVHEVNFSYYPFMHYMIGDHYYCGAPRADQRFMGHGMRFTNKRKAFCRYILSLNVRTLRRYVTRAYNTAIPGHDQPGVRHVVKLLDNTTNS